MKNKKFLTLFQIDPLHKINPKTDSTYKIILQALKLNHKVMYCTPENVFIKFKETYVKAKTLESSEKNENFKIKGEIKEKKISDFDIIFIRQDPPFNMNYILNGYLIEIPKLTDNKKPFFVNSPSGIRNFSEKIFPLLFKSIIPETTISCKKEVLEVFIKKHNKFVLKPLLTPNRISKPIRNIKKYAMKFNPLRISSVLTIKLKFSNEELEFLMSSEKLKYFKFEL